MFPNQIIAGVDAKAQHIATDGWKHKSKTTLSDFINILNESDIASIIYTDIAKDGMMSGPNIEMLKSVASSSKSPVIASGGIRNQDDIASLKSISNLSGCIIGKALLSNLSHLDHFLSH